MVCGCIEWAWYEGVLSGDVMGYVRVNHTDRSQGGLHCLLFHL